MKKIIYILMLLHALAAFPQKHTNLWYFGINAGLDFNSGNPVPVFGGQTFTAEGSSSIADENGSLLFYTDGVTVYNKNHQVMQNGTGLMGHSSCTQSALIVGRPGSDTHFYIFTVGAIEDPNGLHYSEIDMTANGGLGAVTTVKNVNLVAATTEGITATLHSNGEDIWVVVHPSTGNSLLSYLITEEGIAAPVVSNAGPAFEVNFDIMTDESGCMKISPDGAKLAIASMGKGAFVFDFNKATGAVTDAVQVEQEADAPYGIEFSPSGKLLYTTKFEKLTQYNLEAADIAASGIVVLEDDYLNIATLQLASNGKIYKAEALQDYLTVINNPDVLGMGCNAQFMSVYLGGDGYSMLGLPNAITSYFLVPDFEAENVCLNAQTRFALNWNRTPDSVVWNFGDGTTATTVNPVHAYAAAGTYTVQLTITKSTSSWTVNKQVTVTAPPQFAFNGPYEACVASTLLIAPQATNFNPAQATWLWEFNGQLVGSAATLQPQDFGTYTLTVTVNGCSATRNIDVGQVTLSALFSEGCGAGGYTLGADPDNGSFDAATAVYSWVGPDGFTADSPDVVITQAGTYTLNLTADGGCAVAHVFAVADVFCPDALIPKGVSPNGDGKNDVFDLTHHDVARLNIFNRYGQEVFNYGSYTTQWYGQTNSGDALPSGTYFYSIQKNNGQNITGWVYVNHENR